VEAGGACLLALTTIPPTRPPARLLAHDGTVLCRKVRLLEDSPGDVGWDVFSLEYRVEPPITAIFTQASRPCVRVHACVRAFVRELACACARARFEWEWCARMDWRRLWRRPPRLATQGWDGRVPSNVRL
jgi:hypothetical protein